MKRRGKYERKQEELWNKVRNKIIGAFTYSSCLSQTFLATKLKVVKETPTIQRKKRYIKKRFVTSKCEIYDKTSYWKVWVENWCLVDAATLDVKWETARNKWLKLWKICLVEICPSWCFIWKSYICRTIYSESFM